MASKLCDTAKVVGNPGDDGLFAEDFDGAGGQGGDAGQSDACEEPALNAESATVSGGAAVQEDAADEQHYGDWPVLHPRDWWRLVTHVP